MVEYQLPKLTAWVRFPSPAPRNLIHALIAQSAERIHGKDEVIGSIPIEGSSDKTLETLISQCFEGFCLPFCVISIDVKFTVIGGLDNFFMCEV